MVTQDRSRGQLLLISALALAMIIVGLAVLLNAAILTEVRAPDDPATDLVEADRLGDDIETGLAGVLAHANADGPYGNTASLNETVFEHLSTYEVAMFEAVGERRATLLTLGITENDFTYGSYAADANRSSPVIFGDPNDTTWTWIDPDDSAQIADLRFSFEVESINNTEIANAIAIELIGEETNTEYAVVYEENNASVVNRSDGSTVSTCEPEGDYVTVTFGPLPSEDTDCHVDGLTATSPAPDGHGLKIHNAENATGGFMLATEASPETLEGVDEYNPPSDDDPYVTPLIWSSEVRIEQRAHASERLVDRTVSVYEDPIHGTLLEVPWS